MSRQLVRQPTSTLPCASRRSIFIPSAPRSRGAVSLKASLNRSISDAGMSGAVAQLGERCIRIAEVRGSIPLSSTG